MFFVAYAFKGYVHVFAGRVKVVSHSSSRPAGQVQYLNIFVPWYLFSMLIQKGTFIPGIIYTTQKGVGLLYNPESVNHDCRRQHLKFSEQYFLLLLFLCLISHQWRRGHSLKSHPTDW